jgi:glutathione S-transferase
MKLYYSPMACSLADHIALQEAGIEFECERVNLSTKLTATGRNFKDVTVKGYVPALELDNGEILTENIAILDWIASRFPKLGVPGDLGRTRLVEALTYISTELHCRFRGMHGGSDREKAEARVGIQTGFEFMAASFKGDYLFGDAPTVADFYLFVMLLWSGRIADGVPQRLATFRERVRNRDAVKVAMATEGIR